MDPAVAAGKGEGAEGRYVWQLIKVPRSFAEARGIRDLDDAIAPILASTIVDDRSRFEHNSGRGGGSFPSRTGIENWCDSRDADIPRLTFRACPAGSILL